MLQVSASIFMYFSTELAGLYHVDQSGLQLKSLVSNLNYRPSTNVDSSWSRELTECLVGHDFKF